MQPQDSNSYPVAGTERRMTSIFERYLTIWVGLCIVAGIVLGKVAPNLAKTLDGMAITVQGAPVVSIPIAVCLFFMMYPIMVKIDFASVIRAGKSGKPVFLTLLVNWGIKPFTMYALCLLFLGVLFRGLIGAEASFDFAGELEVLLTMGFSRFHLSASPVSRRDITPDRTERPWEW